MSVRPKAYIAGVGMITPVGINSKMTVASVRAGINRYQETDYFDKNFEPVRMALVPDDAFKINLEEHSLIVPMSAREARLLQLAGTAILQVMPLLPSDQKIPVFMAGPDQEDNTDTRINLSFLETLSKVTGMNLDANNSRCINIGRAGGIDIIGTALKYLESAQQQYALVGGVDSFYDLDVINHYINQDRVLTMESMQGFIPGEGAGFILLKSLNDAAAFEKESCAYVFEPGTNLGSRQLSSDEFYRGDALALAFDQALQNAKAPSVTKIYSSMNGEVHWAKELGVAMVRNKKSIHDECTTHHPADCFGDIGAAAGVILIGLASLELVSQKRTNSYLVYGSSDSDYRSAVQLSFS